MDGWTIKCGACGHSTEWVHQYRDLRRAKCGQSGSKACILRKYCGPAGTDPLEVEDEVPCETSTPALDSHRSRTHVARGTIEVLRGNPMNYRSVAERVFSKAVETPEGCWVISTRESKGYARISDRGKLLYAHRVAYEFCRGTIAEGLQIDHLCRVRNCVNPWHLEIVTSRENSLRGQTIPAVNSLKTHCIHGHELTPENTYFKPGCSGRKKRNCKTCQARHNLNRRVTIR
jgi:hypothetical protein